MDGRLLLRDAALNILLRVRLHMLLDHHHALDKDAIFFCDHAKNATLFALVLAGNYFYFVVPLNLDACHCSLILDDRLTAEPDSGYKVCRCMQACSMKLDDLRRQRYD